MYHNDKAFICEICSKAFRFRSNLAEHRSVHTQFKPYVCRFCDKSSRLKGMVLQLFSLYFTYKLSLEYILFSYFFFICC
ncbi:unnamed protein product [Enterobius vermicularis]|uniref:C2H2-type domain-containing protein n=1 Tax=Enterobius vermicularis TaxID=51028 RepID=A0A0N4VKH3_ENTVE|nr:unnamed protein product [Enterobius vermicularis]